MTPDQQEAALLAGILRREGGYRHVPGDRGGPTNYGITAATLGEWRKLGRPATEAEVRALTAEDAMAIYRSWYILPFAGIPNAALKEQLIDFGVNSGPGTAIAHLQRVLGIPVTSSLGANTRAVLDQVARQTIGGRSALAVVNDALVASRLLLIDRLADTRKIPSTDEEGVESRALGFFLATGQTPSGG